MTLTIPHTVPALSKTPALAPQRENGAAPLRSKRRGAAAVEFAIVLPVFVILVLGMIEIGRYIMVQQVLTNASREGARRAVLDGASESEITTAVRTYLNNSAVNGTAATVVFNPPELDDADSGDPVTVTVSISRAAVSWLPMQNYNGAALSASTVMRRETVE